MNFTEYQKEATKTAIYPNRGNNIVYPVLGLAGESGEVAEKVKKLIRDNNGIANTAFVVDVTKELGDVLWYVATICTELKIEMQDVAEMNIKKLQSRQLRNVLEGSGDNR